VSRAWTEQTERGSATALMIIRWLALHLGRGLTRLLLYPITAYYLLRATASHAHSRNYLRRVLGREPGWLDMARHIYCFAATILDRVFLLAGRDGLFDVHVHNENILLGQVRSGKGCLLLGSHLGSFEVLRALGLQWHDLPLKILMYPEHNQTITRLLMSLNPAVADTVIPLGRHDTLLQVHEAVTHGQLVGMLGDRVAESAKTTTCDFLGGQAEFPLGPMLMAAALKVPVILFFGLYSGGNRYDIHFEVLTDGIDVPRGEREAEVQRLTQEYASRLEHYARLAPYNWFNFYDYWKRGS
jgi:predicted LPLAT superfamily acyltransferase